MLVVDRFHFTGNNCENVFNENVHRLLDGDRSVAAEVINSVIDKCVSHIYYLRGNNVLPFMKILFSYLNSCEYKRGFIGRSDLEDEELGQLMRSRFTCNGDCCYHTTLDDTERPITTSLQYIEVITAEEERIQINADMNAVDDYEINGA